jgi:hypothetical protein
MKTMTTIRYGLGIATLVGATVAVGATAEARSVAAFAGQPQNPLDYDCFVNANGVVTNICNTTRQFCVPLVVDDGGPHPVQVEVRASDTKHNLTCFAQVGAQNGGFAGGSQMLPAPALATDVVINLGGQSTPAGGTLWACCKVDPTDATGSAQIESINW